MIPPAENIRPAGELSHVGQPILERGIEAARKRELKLGDFAWDTEGGDIAQIVAITLAHWGVLMFAEEPGESASPEISQDVVNLDEVDLLEAAI
jgi:hypothetical protein